MNTRLAPLKTGLVSAIVNTAPYLSLVPTAYLVFSRTMQHLGWPWFIALAAALSVEFLGLAVTVTALGAYTWNRGKRKADPPAPIVLPVVLVAVYFISAELLTVGLDVAPNWPGTVAQWSQAIFPVLGLAGMAVLAIRYDADLRAAEVKETKAAEKAERKTERERKRAERVQESAERIQVAPEVSMASTYPRLTYAEALSRFPDLLQRDTTEAAALAGVTDRTIRNWRNDGHTVKEREGTDGH